jgi:hypothetical protein
MTDLLWDQVLGRGSYPRSSSIYRLRQDGNQRQLRGEKSLLPGRQQELWIERPMPIGWSVFWVLSVRSSFAFCTCDLTNV